MYFSVIIVSYNSQETLGGCLKSLQALSQEQDFKLEIIVVDNASSDNSVQLLSNFKDVRGLLNSVNRGFAYACNQGARLAQGEILFFLNPDTVAQKAVFTSAQEHFTKNNNLGILAPCLYNTNKEPEQFGWGRFPTLLTLLMRRIDKILLSPGKLSLVDWVSGAALFISKKVFKHIGGFDEGYFMYYEDIDLCYRVKKDGYHIAVMTDTSIFHARGQSLHSNKIRKEYYDASQLRYFQKNSSILSVYTLLFLRSFYRLVKPIK